MKIKRDFVIILLVIVILVLFALVLYAFVIKPAVVNYNLEAQTIGYNKGVSDAITGIVVQIQQKDYVDVFIGNETWRLGFVEGE